MNMEQAPDRWQQVPTLRGEHVTLEPLRSEHGEGLRHALAGTKLWELWYTSIPRPEDVDAYVVTALAAQARGEAQVFVVRDAAGEIVGSTRYYQFDPAVPRLTIGYTWYAPRVQRTGLNTQAKLLLLEHAFDVLGCEAVGFETSWFNQRSRTAIARLGAKQDGVLRNHMRHRDGTLRDTVVFSIVAGEWPGVKHNLLHKLESNRRG